MTPKCEKAIEIINAVSGLDSFTIKQVQNITGIPCPTANPIIRQMHRLKAVLVVGKIKSTVRYKVSHDAVKIVMREFNVAPVYTKRKKSEFECGIKFVDKANVSGMGNPMLMKIDSLLKGVRNELHVMQ